MTTDPELCREWGHLPRRIEPYERNPAMTLELCLRCWTRLLRRRDSGAEVELPRQKILDGEVWQVVILGGGHYGVDPATAEP